MKQKELFRLPDGDYTTDAAAYVEAWHALAKPIEEEMEFKLFSFDPGLTFRSLDWHENAIDVPVSIALAFRRLWERAGGTLKKDVSVQNLDAFRESVGKLKVLLDESETGWFTWAMFIRERLQEIVEIATAWGVRPKGEE